MTFVQPTPRASRRGPPRDWGRSVARVVCLLFALVGLVPVALALVVRSESVEELLASEAQNLLRGQLGLEASFQTNVRLLPLKITLENLVVRSTDGGSPALTLGSLVVRPRPFSLLGGRLDLGDVEIEELRARVVLRNGAFENVTLTLPKTDPNTPTELPSRLPFRSLLLSGADLDVTFDDQRVALGGVDVDAFAEETLAVDLALRVSTTEVWTTSEPGSAYHDRLCGVDLRARLAPDEIRVKRLNLLGQVATAPNTEFERTCETAGEERLALRISRASVALDGAHLTSASGRLLVRAPLVLGTRFAGLPPSVGWAGFTGELDYDGRGRLPNVVGTLTGAGLRIGEYGVAEKLHGNVRLERDVVVVPSLTAGWANGTAVITDARIAPFEPKGPLSVRHIDVRDMNFPGVMRDIAMTRNTIVDWDYDHVSIDKVRGQLSPFYLDGGVDADTSNFTVYDRAFHAAGKQRMVGAPPAKIVGRWRATPTALEFYETLVRFGSSSLPVGLVSIGFSNTFGLLVGPGAELDLEDIGPLAGVTTKGRLKLEATAKGPMNDPSIEGRASIDDFELGGFGVGDIEHTDLHFRPLRVDFSNLRGRKGAMAYALPKASLDFGGEASVDFEADVTAPTFSLADFENVFHFDTDPRFAGFDAQGLLTGHVHYLLGGPRDPCESGRLWVDADADLREVAGFDETFQRGTGSFHLDWFDMDAGTRGMDLLVPAFRLEKGTGSVHGEMRVRRGGFVEGEVLATRIPVSRLDLAKGSLAHAEGYVSGRASLDGTLERLGMKARVALSSLQTGGSRWGPSELTVTLLPDPKPPTSVGRTACGRGIPPVFERAVYDADEPDGEFVVDGQLFDGSLLVRDLRIPVQRKKHARGEVRLEDFDAAGALEFAGLSSPRESSLKARVSGTFLLTDLDLGRPTRSVVNARLDSASVETPSGSLRLVERPLEISIENRAARLSPAVVEMKSGGGARALLDLSGEVGEGQRIQATLELRETSLSVFTQALPSVTQADGKLHGRIEVGGVVTAPEVRGNFSLSRGRIGLRGLDVPITDIELGASIDTRQFRIDSASARLGGGTLSLSGGAPIRRLALGDLELALSARDVSLPFEPDVRVTLDSDLRFLVPSEPTELPSLTGDVVVARAEYARPMSISADLSDLAARGRKTEVANYDPKLDRLNVDLLVRALRPITVKNELVEAELVLDPRGVHVTGTDQRFGAIGSVSIEQGGQVRLRRNVFEIRSGVVRFTDSTRIAPEVDVSATTEFRRSQDRSQNATTMQTAAVGGASAGNWRITMHAYGSPENLRVDLKSDPPLGSDDIFLLLTVGMTRTELDQSRSAGVGGTVALEALGSLSGAESAVTDTLPIDEFRFGSLYSTKSGRSEPTVTLGKRLSDRIRATVTSTMSDTSEVRSNVEYQATERLSVEGSYDNAQRAGAPAIGNLGGNIRWRLEFE